MSGLALLTCREGRSKLGNARSPSNNGRGAGCAAKGSVADKPRSVKRAALVGAVVLADIVFADDYGIHSVNQGYALHNCAGEEGDGDIRELREIIEHI